MQHYKQPTVIQVQKIRQNWARMSRFGFLPFVLLSGTAVFLFSTTCWIGFTYLGGQQKLLHMAVVWETTIPWMVFLSYFGTSLYYGAMWMWIRRVGAATQAS
jgi:hypothetical protein